MSHRTPRTGRAIVVASVLALALAACGGGSTAPDEPAPAPAPEAPAEDAAPALSGSVGLDGSSTVGPFQEVAAELFMEANPGVRVTVAISGTGGGFEKFCNGETDGSNASRLIKDSEIELCEANGIKYDFIQVANDALSVVVNKDAPVECLSVEQLNAVWKDGSTVTTWGDIPGLTLTSAQAAVPMKLYGPGTDSGTFDFFTEAINGESGSIGRYTDIGEDDTAAVVGVSGDVGAMAFIPFSYYQEAQDQVKGIAIDGGEGCVEPTPENVLALVYKPLGRGLFTYFSDKALAKPETVAFARFVLDNAKDIAVFAEFVPLTDAQIGQERAKIDALIGG